MRPVSGHVPRAKIDQKTVWGDIVGNLLPVLAEKILLIVRLVTLPVVVEFAMDPRALVEEDEFFW